jgi:outer membrane protein assembly factor BamE (lipoprotein component of BamABCDE complex)
MLAKIFVAAALAVTLSGCVVAVGGDHDFDDDSNWKKTQRYNQEQVNKLQMNMTADDIRTLMGKPDFSESFNKDGETVQVLFYRTHHSKSDGKTTKEECTPLIFKQNKLVGWGDKAYQYL